MKISKETCDQSCFMCRLCQPEWLPAIRANCRQLNYTKGEELFSEGQQVTGMYFVYKGAVKVHKQWAADKELIVRIASKGDIVGHRGLGEDAVYPVSATALEPVTACFVDMSFFSATLKVNNGFLYELMLFFASELKLSERKMRNLAHMPVKGRLAQALISIQEKFGTDKEGMVNLSVSRQDLASFTGTTYETIFRTMQELSEERLVQVNGKKIAIIDKEGLQRLIQTGV